MAVCRWALAYRPGLLYYPPSFPFFSGGSISDKLSSGADVRDPRPPSGEEAFSALPPSSTRRVKKTHSLLRPRGGAVRKIYVVQYNMLRFSRPLACGFLDG